MSEDKFDNAGYNQTPSTEFHNKLQDVVIQQAQRMINFNLYVKALLSTLPVALIAADKDGLIRTVNNAAEEILGINQKKTQGKELIKLFEPNSELVEKIEKALSEGKQFYMGSQSVDFASDNNIVANICIEPILDEDKEICGVLFTIEDQTYVSFLQNAFKRYVPPSVSEIIARDPQQLELGGEEKNLTVLFSDLIGFTTLSEKMSPPEIVKLLSEYFDEMTNVIFKNEGTLKEYVADELMAIFGAPVYQSDHAKRACKSAIAMSKRLKELRGIWSKQNRPQLKARIGINTGSMLVGNLGSTHRFSYGVVGDQVNLGSRLEGLNNKYGTEILVGENTANELDNDFHLREIDLVRVKGRNQSVRIFELLDEAGNPLADKTKKVLEYYNKGLSLYRNKDWLKAIEFFQIIGNLSPEDGPTKIMKDRCHHYMKNPPPLDWDSVFEHDEK